VGGRGEGAREETGLDGSSTDAQVVLYGVYLYGLIWAIGRLRKIDKLDAKLDKLDAKLDKLDAKLDKLDD
jgi:hypothetical protein